MPKPTPPSLEIREFTQRDLVSLGDVTASAPDDGTAYQWDTSSTLYKPLMSSAAIKWYRRVACDPTMLIRVALVDGKGVAFSIWTRTELSKDGSIKSRPWRKRIWFDALNIMLIGFENDYRNFYRYFHPPELQPNLNRRAALTKARARDPTPPKDQAFYELTGIAVHSSYQGHGIGTVLVQWGIDRASEEGVPVYTKGEERGVKFYESLGFEKVRASEYWIGADGKEISREEVESGNVDWKKENGGVSGAAVVWWPSDLNGGFASRT